jgi:hypothetical protein
LQERGNPIPLGGHVFSAHAEVETLKAPVEVSGLVVTKLDRCGKKNGKNGQE